MHNNGENGEIGPELEVAYDAKCAGVAMFLCDVVRSRQELYLTYE